MRFPLSLLIFAAALLSTSPYARATVAIFAGAEQHRTHINMAGIGHSGVYGVIQRPGRIFFLYELESGRSVEIRLELGKFKVRTERNLAAFTATRGETWPYAYDTSLMDAKRNQSTSVDSVTVQGTITPKGKPWGPLADPATGLPYTFPATLVSRQDYATHGVGEYGGVKRVRKTSSLVLNGAQTKASNGGSETFDAALLRVKNLLTQRGLTETSSLDNWADL